MGRRCKYIDTDGDTVFGVCHGFGFKAWTHGGGATIGSFPPGQESYAVAIVEHESDGTISQVAVGRVTMLESDEPAPEQRCRLLEQRCRLLEQLARGMYEWADHVANRYYAVVPERVRGFREQLEALGVSPDEQ